jgi:peptidoglycan/xylan/chitin deacetylase (PgdA/CDA1 family)
MFTYTSQKKEQTMVKKIIGALLFVLLVLGSSGCTRPKPNPPAQTPLTTINPANETDQQESPNKSSTPLSPLVNQAVPILYYHSVMLENGNDLRMPPEAFEAQMAYLQDKGFHSVSLEQLYQASYKGGALPAKPFVITFDDGYVDNYTTAYPILKKHGFTATVFMVTSYINGAAFMSWPQLKELVANGWEIEGHTTNHPFLTKIDPSTVFSELRTSKEILEKELGQPVDFLAYPNGDLNAKVVQVVKDTGYLMAVTTARGWADDKTDAYHVHRVYCFASMGMNEFTRRLQNPNY